MSTPFQATHTADDGRYYIVDGCEWFYANHMGQWKRHWSGAPAGLKELAKKPWSGPEDGLPPVGSTVQVWDKEPHKFYAKHVGKNVSILAHRIGSYDEEVAVYCVKADDGTDEYHALVEACFRPIQQQEDKRETAIRELMDIAQVDCRVTAARLVDAGFKREVK